jgi:hypothetical protein
MKFQIKSVSASGTNYDEAVQSLARQVNYVCDEINENPDMEVTDIRYEQSIQTYYMKNQWFYVAAFIHYNSSISGEDSSS